jgi:alpha-beta hydrolase superfamily lysophospholipase
MRGILRVTGRFRMALIWLCGAAVVLYLGLVGVLYVGQRRILYPAPQTFRTGPSEAGFPQAEEVVLQSADGEKLIVWHVPPAKDRPVVIFYHGNGEVLAWRVPRFRALTADGIGLVALSYRGYGGSTGAPTEAGLMADAVMTYDFAAKQYDPQRLAIWGYSLGSGLAVAIAANHTVGNVVLEAPYTSTADVAQRMFPLVPVRLLMRDQYRSDQLIGRIKAPLLIMHGERDQAIDISLGRHLFALAPEPKRFVSIPDGRHENLDSYGAVDVVRRFIAGEP